MWGRTAVSQVGEGDPRGELKEKKLVVPPNRLTAKPVGSRKKGG